MHSSIYTIHTNIRSPSKREKKILHCVKVTSTIQLDLMFTSLCHVSLSCLKAMLTQGQGFIFKRQCLYKIWSISLRSLKPPISTVCTQECTELGPWLRQLKCMETRHGLMMTFSMLQTGYCRDREVFTCPYLSLRGGRSTEMWQLVAGWKMKAGLKVVFYLKEQCLGNRDH